MIVENFKVVLVLVTVCHSALARSGKASNQVDNFFDDDDLITVADRKAKLRAPAPTLPPPAPVAPAQPKAVKVGHGTYPDDGTNINTTLVFVEAIFRHGDKFKEEGEFFEKDPYKIEDPFWLPFGLGQLRNMGKQRTYWLGQFLRMRYGGGGFLGEQYFYRDVFMTSVDTDKNLMSAELVLLGLFPPKGINIWNDNVGRYYQPIPVHGIQYDLDYVLNQIACGPYTDALAKVFKEDLADLNLKNRDLFTTISKASGTNITNLGDLWQIYNIIRIEFENGRALPEWVKPLYIPKIKPLALTSYEYFVKSDFMKTIKSGPLLHKLLTDFDDKINKNMEPNYRMKLYSTSDVALMSLLKTLGVDEDAPLDPDYGATILIELHKLQEKYYIKINYMDNGFKRYCLPLKFKGYDTKSTYLIPYEKFVEVNAKFRINEEGWYNKCSIPYC